MLANVCYTLGKLNEVTMTELPDIMRLLLIIFNTLIALYAGSRLYELSDSSFATKTISAAKRTTKKAKDSRKSATKSTSKRAKKSLRSVQKIVAKTNATPIQTKRRSPTKKIPVNTVNEPLTFTHLDELESDNAKSEAATDDDFTKIQGIGPKSEQILKQAGVTSYDELSSISPEKIKSILVQADHRYAMYEVTYWPRQAKLAAQGDWEKFKALKHKLGSRRV